MFELIVSCFYIAFIGQRVSIADGIFEALLAALTIIYQWRSQPIILRGGKMFDFRRVTLFCLQKRLSKHKTTIFS